MNLIHFDSMKFTCLSRGSGFHFPPCHILNMCGFRILVDCPVDLSALTIFAPVPADFCSMQLDDEHAVCSSNIPIDIDSGVQKRQKIIEPLDAKHLINAEPWYKTVSNLHLWNTSFIDIVLISSPMGMLGLPFLTRDKGFSAKIYVTEASARLGQLLMEDLVSMHAEFKYFYGPEESTYPQWMKWEELELLPSSLKEIALGKDGTELGGWIPLYSAADVKDCVQKLQTLKYAEETCYNGTLVIKAFSSGSEMGACNWTINGPKGNVACVSSSTFVSAHAMDFDYHALQGNHVIVYSDFSSQVVNNNSLHGNDSSDSTTAILSTPRSDEDNWKELTKSLLSNEENIEEKEKLAFICSCMIDSVKAGGSVLIPTTRLGLIVQLLEQISVFLDSSNLTVPIYFISSIAEELFAFTNVIPEWLCKQRQEKLFSGDPLFGHSELIKEKKLLVFHAIHSQELLTNWEEPCIVFSPHWSLRIGPTVHLLRRWCRDENSLLVLEEAMDANVALLPFKPMKMKVLQCSFLSGIKLPKVKPLLDVLQPKIVLLPEALRHRISFSNSSSFSIMNYSENETLRVPRCEDNLEIEIATDLVSKLQWRKTKKESLNLVRLKGELFMDHGKHRLLSGKEPMDSSEFRPLLHWGSPDLQRLLDVLSEMGISGSIEQVTSDNELETKAIVHINDPNKALIEVRTMSTIVTAAAEDLASQIFQAIDRVLDGI